MRIKDRQKRSLSPATSDENEDDQAEVRRYQKEAADREKEAADREEEDGSHALSTRGRKRKKPAPSRYADMVDMMNKLNEQMLAPVPAPVSSVSTPGEGMSTTLSQQLELERLRLENAKTQLELRRLEKELAQKARERT